MSSTIFLDPITRQFIDAVTAPDSPAVYDQPVEVARANDIASQAAYRTTVEADSMDLLADGPGSPIPVRILRPKRSREVLPLIVFFHGGGWVLGDRQTADRLARDLVVAADAAVAIVEYSRAPEAQYPVAIEECCAATQYLHENADRLRLDRSRLAVAGHSAGGNLATVVS
jgi:acetyl esterase/lipase